MLPLPSAAQRRRHAIPGRRGGGHRSAVFAVRHPAPRSGVPDDILFSFFFHHLEASEAASNATGDSPVKRGLQVKAGLTASEFSIVRQVALGCNEAYDAKTRSGAAEVRQLALQNSSNGRSPQAAPPAVVARIGVLERERSQVVTACLDSLKRGLGEARFAILHRYVRAEGASVRYIDPRGQNVRAVPPPPFLPGGGAEQGGKQ